MDHRTEDQGLDLTQMGEQAYDQQLDLHLELGNDALMLKLCTAAAQGELATLKMLLRAHADPYGADYDERTPLQLAAAGGYVDIVDYLISHFPQAPARHTPTVHSTAHPERARVCTVWTQQHESAVACVCACVCGPD